MGDWWHPFLFSLFDARWGVSANPLFGQLDFTIQRKTILICTKTLRECVRWCFSGSRPATHTYRRLFATRSTLIRTRSLISSRKHFTRTWISAKFEKHISVCSFSAVTKLRMRICQTCSISGHTGNYNLLRFASIKDFDAGSEDNIVSLSDPHTSPWSL